MHSTFFKVTLLLLFFCRCAFALELRSNAKQAVVYDYDTKTVVFSHKADEKMHPSSMSKMMTLYVIFQMLKDGTVQFNDEYRVSRKAWEVRGSSMFLKEGQKVTVEDLVRGIAIVSGNDASITIAEGSLGSEEVFVSRMNEVATKIGLKDSHFVNSTGLNTDDHYMTANDVLRLAVRIYEDFPEYYHFFSEKNFSFNGVHQSCTNEMITYANNENDQGIVFDGVKTGSTDGGGYGLAASATSKGKRLFVIVNGLENRKSRAREVKYLARYFLKNINRVMVLDKEISTFSLNVLFSYRRNIPIHVSENIVVPCLNKCDSDFKVTLHYVDNLRAPLKQGDVVGYAEVESEFGKVKVSLILSKDARSFPSVLYLFLRWLL